MISLLIPTLNRSEFLIRLLYYYVSLDFQGSIWIGDSSDASHVARARRAIATLNRRLGIVYREYPGLNNGECVRNMLQSVDTSYAVLLPDDDFLVPRSLEQCTTFLERHPEYGAAHGVAVLFGIEGSGAYGPVSWVSRYLQRPIEGEKGVERLVDHLKRYSVTLFSVHRTALMRAMFEDVPTVKDKSLALELLPCCVSVIGGKVKELDCLYLARQAHDQRYLLPDVFDWITGPEWFSSYQVFRDRLAEHLAKQDGISVEEARGVVKQAFWAYLGEAMKWKWEERYAPCHRGPSSAWRSLAERIPGAPRGWRGLRSLVETGRGEMSLRGLLRGASPYHTDFLPICRAITMPPSELVNGGAAPTRRFGATTISSCEVKNKEP